MQSPKFILKNKYQEKNVERDYEYHLKKLVQIKNKITVKTAIDQDQEQMDQVLRRHKNQMKASKFKEGELDRERNYESGSLYDRLLVANQSGPIKQVSSPNLLKNSLSQTSMIQTKSLVLVVQKNEESRIMEENYKLAKRMQNLPPVISSLGQQSSYTKHKDDVLLARKFHKLQPLTPIPQPQSRLSVFVDVLNDLTNNQFEECKSHITFPVIEERIHKNTMFCILYMQNMKVFNDYDLHNPKVPPKFCWEIKYRNKSLSMTIPKSFNKICKDLVDFVFRKNQTDKLDLILWKIKDNDETYIGQVEIGPDDFDEGEVVQEFHKKMIKQKMIEKEMYKKVNSVKAFLGTVQFKMISFCSKNIPQNKHSGIPGSPNSAHQRRNNERIEESKYTPQDEYDWQSLQDEEHQILLIIEANKEGIAFMIMTEENVSAEVMLRFKVLYDKLDQIKWFETEDNVERRRKGFVLVCRVRQDQIKSIMEIIKILDLNEGLTEVYKKIREHGYKGKVSRKMIDDGIKECNCTINQLLLHKKDDMNLNLLGIMFLEDQYPTILEIFNRIDLLQESDSILDELANDLFNNIARHLRKNHNLKALKVFIKALENYPGISIIIFKYSTSDINRGIKTGKCNVFLSNFNMNNYEHIMILGRVIKLCNRHLNRDKLSNAGAQMAETMMGIGTDWLDSLKVAYANEKRNVYFKVPILPKKGQLSQKADLLQLSNLESNIFNEIVRRKRWNLFTHAYPNASRDTADGGPDWYFQKDSTCHSPFMNFMQGASYDDIKNFLIHIDAAQGSVPIDPQKIQDCITPCGKNIFHLLIMNKDPSQEGLLNILQVIIERLGPESTACLLEQAWGSGYIALKVYPPNKKLPPSKSLRLKVKEAQLGLKDKFSPDFTPLVLYMERLASKCKKNKNQHNNSTQSKLKGLNSINQIVKILSEPFVKKDTAILRQLYNLNYSLGIQVLSSTDDSNFYQDNQQVIKCLVNLDNPIFEQIVDNLSWIHWIGPQLATQREENTPILLLSLIKTNQFTRCTQIIEQMMETNLYIQPKLDPTINEKLDEDQQRQYEDFCLIERARILVVCLSSLKELGEQDKQYQEEKLLLFNSISQRIRASVQQNPNILFKQIRGASKNSTLLNQIYHFKQEAVINKLPLPNFSQISKEVIHETLSYAVFKQQQSLLESEIIKAMIHSIDDKISLIQYFAMVPETLLKIFPQECLHPKINFDMKVFVNQPQLIQTITDNINRMKRGTINKKQFTESIQESPQQAEISIDPLEKDSISKEQSLDQTVENLGSDGPSIYFDQVSSSQYGWFLESSFPNKLLKTLVTSQKSEQFIIFIGYVYKIIEKNDQSQNHREHWDKIFRDYIIECFQQTPSSKQLFAGLSISVYIQLIRSNPTIINDKWMKKLFVLFLRQENYTGLHHLLLLLTTHNKSLFDANLNQYYFNKKDLKNYFEAASRVQNSLGHRNKVIVMGQKKNWALVLNNKQFASMLTDVKEFLTDNDLYGLCNILAVNGLYEKLKMVSDKVRNEIDFLRILERTSYLAYNQIRDVYFYIYTPLIVMAQQVKDQFKLDAEREKDQQDTTEQDGDIHQYYSEKGDKIRVWGYVETFYPHEINQFIRTVPQRLNEKQIVASNTTSEKIKPLFISKWSNLHSGQLQTLVNGIYKLAWPLNNRLKNYHYLTFLTVEKSLYKQEQQAALKKCLLNSNPSTLFVQKREIVNKDYTQVLMILVDQVIQRKMIKRNINPLVGELAVKIISQCWLSLGNFEKISELLSQTDDPYTKRTIIKLIRNATQIFSDKSNRIKRNTIKTTQQIFRESKTMDELIDGHIKLSDSTSTQRYKKNLFKTKILANILPQLVVFMKKHFNSSTLIAIVPSENYFYQNIKSVFSERLQELTVNQRFMIEFIFTIESNFTPQEISQIPIDRAVQEENNGSIFERLPSLLLSLKTADKKVVSFLQKHLSKKSTEHNAILKDPLSVYQGNQEFIISMAKQGVNCFMEPPNIQRQQTFKGGKGRDVTFKHINLFAQQNGQLSIESSIDNIQQSDVHDPAMNKSQHGSDDWEQVSNPKLNLLEYLLFKGADYLLNGYFLPHLKPKGGLSEPERKRLIMCALQSSNATCLQMVFDEILNLKGPELKNTILKYSLVQATAKNENPASLLWLLRKKLRTLESFTKEEIYQMAGVSSSKDPNKEGYIPLLASIAHKHQSSFYKEFFHDFVHKHILKGSDSDFKEVMETIFYFKRSEWNMAKSDPVNWNLLEYCLNLQFFDVVQTFCQFNLTYPEDELEAHKGVLSEIPKCRSFFSLQSSQNIDNQLRQDYFQQMHLLQASLKLYKICKTQTTLNQSLSALSGFEAGIFLLPYYKSLKIPFTPISEQYIVPRLIQLLALGELQFSTLGELSDSDLTKDIHAKLFLLHMNGVDKQLQYTLTIDKFVEKNLLVKQSKIYTQIWKNKEVLELITTILNDNITDGFKHKLKSKPSRKEIFELCYRSLPQSGATNILFEYFAANDPSLFIKPLQFTEEANNKTLMMPQSIYSDLMSEDQRFLMIVVRGISDKGSSDLLEEMLNYLVERSNEIVLESSTDKDEMNASSKPGKISPSSKTTDSNGYKTVEPCMGFKRNILSAFTALLMVNPQKYAKTIFQHLKEVTWIPKLKEDLPHAAYILTVLYNLEGSFSDLSNSLKILMDGLNRNSTYSLISEVKPLGDLGVNINDEKIYLEGVKLMVEEGLKLTQQKVFFPPDTFTRIISSSVKQSLPVHGDKIFKGFAIMKVFVDIAREIENLSMQLKDDKNQRIGELEYRIEVLQADSANKQSVVLLQQGIISDDKYKFLFKLPIGLQKTDQQLSIYPQPHLGQVQVEQAKQTLSQLYLEKSIRMQWAEDLLQLEKNDISVKISWDSANTENMIYFGEALYTLFGLANFDTQIQKQLPQDSKFKSITQVVEQDREYVDRYKNQYNPESFKIMVNDKKQELPRSNYVQRVRKTNLKLKQENELAFIELHGSFSYYARPSYNVQVVGQQDLIKRLKPISMVHQAINDLYSYSAMAAEYIRVTNSLENQQVNEKSEVFKVNVHWPIYFNSSDELVYNEEFHPFTMITNIQKRFDDWISFNNLMRRDRNIKISILSVMETTVLKLAHMFEKNLRQFKSIDLYAIIDIALQWNLLKIVIISLLEQLDISGLEGNDMVFNSIYIELAEIEAKKCYDSKTISNHLEGLDQIFRLAPTSFYVHNGVLVIRLNVGLIKNDSTPLDNLVNKSAKLRNSMGSSSIMMENNELKNYMNSILNKDSMVNQIQLNQKRNQ